jgi:exodeoxyribonuclease VII large subunit
MTSDIPLNTGDPNGKPRSNIPEMSVSELAFSLKRTLEETYGRVRVRGELSRVKIHTSGHLYSDLKDGDAVINIVCWKTSLARLGIKPEEGLEVICTGRITTYPARSNYQLIVESMTLAGEGALLKMLEDRRKKLASEGLFDEGRKKPLPFLPEVIGVVTSPTGAVLRDIMHRLRDRFPRHVLLWPVLVQGPGAAAQIAAAIQGFDALTQGGPVPRPDVIIVARGGGSLEDLMPFNEEIVARAAASSRIPLISAVGHETDTTLIDHAADRRAPTPTAAAEMAVPRRLDLLERVTEHRQRTLAALRRLIATDRHRLETLAARLGDPRRTLEMRTQRLDSAMLRLEKGFAGLVQRHDVRLHKAAGRLTHPRSLLAEKGRLLALWRERLADRGRDISVRPQERLDNLARMLESLSFKKVLERGYAVVRDEAGHVIARAAGAQPGQAIRLQFGDGNLAAKVENNVENIG